MGSEELEPGDGWPYTNILRRLADEPTLDGTGLGAVVVEEYLASYASRNDTVTQCAVDVSTAGPADRGVRGGSPPACAGGGRRRPSAGRSPTRSLSSVRFQGQLVDVGSLCRDLRSRATSTTR